MTRDIKWEMHDGLTGGRGRFLSVVGDARYIQDRGVDHQGGGAQPPRSDSSRMLLPTEALGGGAVPLLPPGTRPLDASELGGGLVSGGGCPPPSHLVRSGRHTFHRFLLCTNGRACEPRWLRDVYL